MTRIFRTVTLALMLAPAALALAQSQVAPETHPVGDIPDSQAFVRYVSTAGGYSLEVPEGWARTVKGGDVTFASNLGAVEVVRQKQVGVPSVISVRSTELAALAKTNPGLRVSLVKAVTLPAGPAVLARFTSTSAPNAVTGKRVKLDNDVYVLAKNGREVMLHFSAPLGSDNVDAWKQMADSLRWR